MSHPVPGWIKDLVPGKTFADIGGIGVKSGNERISTAVRAGARSATMIDLRDFGHPDWIYFEQLMRSKNITGYKRIEHANLEDKSLRDRIGIYDLVHSTGILYHSPSPILALQNLASVTRTHLIVNTVIVPQRIENAAGSLDFEGPQVVFLPGLDRKERSIFQFYFAERLGWSEKKFNDNIPAQDDPSPVMPYVQPSGLKREALWTESGDLSYSPYWWLWTQQAFEALLGIFRFQVRERYWFKNHAMTVLCERRPQATGAA